MKAKRCPFCNSHTLTIDVTEITHSVRCMDCDACGPLSTISAENAVQWWNGTHPHCNPSALVCDRNSNHHQMKEIEV
jgi:hypothetical protein